MLSHPGTVTALVALVALALLLVWLRDTPLGACRTPDAEACHGRDAALYEVHGNNPCLVVRARVGQSTMAFCVDTGFAGPCLLSLPCLAHAPPPGDAEDIGAYCARVQGGLATAPVAVGSQQAALHAFVHHNRCSDFTAGCTMRLSSVGATKEQTSEMLLTPALQLRTPDGAWTAPRTCSGQPAGEVLTSTTMPTLHILTCDWLNQNGPALLCPHDGVLRTNLTAAEFAGERASLHSVSTERSGGAFVATVRVGGVPLRCTVDSGAACYLSVGQQAASKLTSCQATDRTMHQVGANGEHICSRVVVSRVDFGGVGGDVPVLINDRPLDGEDGYLGVCFLRHFDLCCTTGALYARRNGAAWDATLLDGIFGRTPCVGSAPPRCQS